MSVQYIGIKGYAADNSGLIYDNVYEINAGDELNPAITVSSCEKNPKYVIVETYDGTPVFVGGKQLMKALQLILDSFD